MKMKNKMTKTDRFNSEKIESEEKNAFSQFFHSCGVYIHKNYAFLILFFVGLFAVSAINFMKITTVQTVANFSISDFEIGFSLNWSTDLILFSAIIHLAGSKLFFIGQNIFKVKHYIRIIDLATLEMSKNIRQTLSYYKTFLFLFIVSVITCNNITDSIITISLDLDVFRSGNC